MNEFMIINEYNKESYSYLDDLLNCALKRLKLESVMFNVILTSDEVIKNLNHHYRGINQVTDVISFALNDNGILPGPINVLGDIYISIPQMTRQAKEYGHSEKRELAFLTIHGLLHLLGFNHETKADEKKMFTLQEAILNEKAITR